jgi:hypothetical protein
VVLAVAIHRRKSDDVGPEGVIDHLSGARHRQPTAATRTRAKQAEHNFFHLAPRLAKMNVNAYLQRAG